MIEFYDVEKKMSIENEIKLMQMIDHPHIVKYFGQFMHSIEIQCILMEFCEVCKDVCMF
jgi:serine/threonine protein kinase